MKYHKIIILIHIILISALRVPVLTSRKVTYISPPPLKEDKFWKNWKNLYMEYNFFFVLLCNEMKLIGKHSGKFRSAEKYSYGGKQLLPDVVTSIL